MRLFVIFRLRRRWHPWLFMLALGTAVEFFARLQVGYGLLMLAVAAWAVIQARGA